ncbi:unnamed protein product [Lampetra fluviatilis]
MGGGGNRPQSSRTPLTRRQVAALLLCICVYPRDCTARQQQRDPVPPWPGDPEDLEEPGRVSAHRARRQVEPQRWSGTRIGAGGMEEGPVPAVGEVTGTWGQWGPWSPCTRTCEGGVMEQMRPCLPAAPRAPSPPAEQGGHGYGHHQQQQQYQRRRQQHGYSDLQELEPVHASHQHQQYQQHQQQQQHQLSRLWHGARGSAHSLQGRFPARVLSSMHRSQPPLTRLRASRSTHATLAHQTGQALWPAGGAGSGSPRTSISCVGAFRRHRLCNAQPCPAGVRDFRTVQCANYNGRPFMGRHYEWEPFTEVRVEHRCELNCKAVGYKFYVRHAERVIDGTSCVGKGEGEGEGPPAPLTGPPGTLGHPAEPAHTDAVMHVCVTGQCKRVGCDGLLGSGLADDRCGTCGGDGGACRVVAGTFRRAALEPGYHRVVAIPAGATHIRVSELTRSRNYLALMSHTGVPIVNGNWAIDRPGRFGAAGTEFVYQRPSEGPAGPGETLTARGPTSEPVDVYVIFQQPEPAVSYEFVVPRDGSHDDGQRGDDGNDGHRGDGGNHSDDGDVGVESAPLGPPGSRVLPGALGTPGPVPAEEMQNGASGAADRQPGTPTPGDDATFATETTVGREVAMAIGRQRAPSDPVAMVALSPRLREHNWKQTGSTECTVTCGHGQRVPVFGCVHRTSQRAVPDSLCDATMKPSPEPEACATKPCPAYWDLGEWSECTRTCGSGVQHRQVLCRQVYAGRASGVHPSRCRHLPAPDTSSPCQEKICSEWLVRGDWSPCSVPCGLGERARDVACVSNAGDSVPDSECNPRLRPPRSEACARGPCATSWFHTAWSARCSGDCGAGGVHTRSVVCLASQAGSLPLGGCGPERPPATRACTPGPCPPQTAWYTGPWGQCSSECGAGTESREIICVRREGEGEVVVPRLSVRPALECSGLARPHGSRSCERRACGARWYGTAWSACSRSCGGGVRVRELRCLHDDFSGSAACRGWPAESEACGVEPCLTVAGSACQDKFPSCHVVAQARLCAYPYYRSACCAACAHRTAPHHHHYRHSAATTPG